MEANILLQTKGLTVEERKSLLGTIRKINRKRKHDGMPCLQYRIEADEKSYQPSTKKGRERVKEKPKYQKVTFFANAIVRKDSVTIYPRRHKATEKIKGSSEEDLRQE